MYVTFRSLLSNHSRFCWVHLEFHWNRWPERYIETDAVKIPCEFSTVKDSKTDVSSLSSSSDIDAQIYFKIHVRCGAICSVQSQVSTMAGKQNSLFPNVPCIK